MSLNSSKPQSWLNGCIDAHRRLETVIAHLTDEMARRPSLLESWTVGHLLTHVARNADSQTGPVEAAQCGEIASRYPGGQAQRDGDIAAGAGRPAHELVADVLASNQKLEQAWASTGDEVWATGLGLAPQGRAYAIAQGVFSRWREVEVHLVDLDLPELGGPDWDAMSSSYVDIEWQEILAGLPQRIPEGMTLLLVPGDRPSRAFGSGEQNVTVRAAPGRILAWLMGRGGDSSWPDLGPWP